MKRTITVILALAIAITSAALALTIPEAKAESGTSALFINVGKADAALLFLGERRYLIDTGTSDSFDALSAALDAYDISRLDGVILSHTDKDHTGGLKKLLKSGVTVDMLYAGEIYSESDIEEHTVYKSSQKFDVPLTWLAAGDELQMGLCTMRVLGPLSRDELNENNNSLLIDIITPDGSMLFTGDMELQEEAELMSKGLIPNTDVLKVSHHGEDDATSRAFVWAASPEWAVISTSTAEEPDTPDNKVLSRLWEIKCGVAVTQDASMGILVTLDGGTVTVEALDYN